MIPPQIVSQNDGLWRSRIIILFAECPSKLRAHAISFKKARGDAKSYDIHRLISICEDRRVESVGRHRLKAPASLTPVVKTARADLFIIRRCSRLISQPGTFADLQLHQVFRFLVWQRFENE